MPGKELTFLLGGAGAGKSSLAVRLATAAAGERGAVLFVATALLGDSEMEQKVKRHKAARPRHWRLVEEPYDLAGAVETHATGCNVVVVDCLTMWVSNLLLRQEGDPTANDHVLAAAQQLIDAWESGTRSWFIVSNEVGMGVVPPYPLGRAYRELLGRVNQLVASRATKAYLVVAGLALDLKALGPLAAFHGAGQYSSFPERDGGGG